MDQINIYSGDKVISSILVEGTLAGLQQVLAPYKRVYAVMDKAVAMDCPAAAQLADILNGHSVPGMLVEAHESTKTMDTVMSICSWLLEQGADRVVGSGRRWRHYIGSGRFCGLDI